MPYVTPGAVILVTGATGGIGFEIAAQAAQDGAVVGVHGSRPERVADAIARIEARAPEAKLVAVPGDFLQPGVIDGVIAKMVAEGGRLDAVIHCAVTAPKEISGLFFKTNVANFGQLAQSILAVFQQLCFAALPHLSERGGTIISFASDAGRFAAARQSMVGAVFGGIMAFVRNLSVELARNGVRVHCISPSYVVETPVYEAYAARGSAAAERAGLGLPSPRDIAPMTLFLCSPDAAKITGQVISINGGLNA
jgi:3-oxoacyl-[acyl-carrier protein] reductase